MEHVVLCKGRYVNIVNQSCLVFFHDLINTYASFVKKKINGK